MSKGIIYFIQPHEFIGTDIYKIGMSEKMGYKRVIQGYKKNTEIICVFKCSNPKEIESKIINIFTIKYKLYKGREYFQGNCNDMLVIFNQLIGKYIQDNITNKGSIFSEKHIYCKKLILNEKSSYKNKCYYLLNNDSNTFNLDIFENNLYIEKLKEWFNNIKQIINFEDTQLLLTQKEIDEIHKKYGYNISINKKDEVINNITFIKKYLNKKLINILQNQKDNNNILQQNYINNNMSDNIKYIVVFNKIYCSSFLIKNPDNIDNELLNSEKCGFKKYYEFSIEKDNIDFIKMINTLLSYNVTDENDLKKKNDLITNLYNQYKNDMKTKTEFENIKDFITNSYDINDNINDKIKASDILTIIENYFCKTNNTNFIKGDIHFRNKLSKYLTYLGLKKKRLSDGIYYFGLVLKDNTKYKNNCKVDYYNDNLKDNKIKKYLNTCNM